MSGAEPTSPAENQATLFGDTRRPPPIAEPLPTRRETLHAIAVIVGKGRPYWAGWAEALAEKWEPRDPATAAYYLRVAKTIKNFPEAPPCPASE
jgi:hypothetical protein